VSARPLRLLVLDEGVLGHRTTRRQLEAILDGATEVEARMVSVPAPSRLGRVLLRHSRRLGDADMLLLRWRLRWSWRARRLLKRHAGWADVALIVTQASALLSRGPMRRLPCVLLVDATVRQFVALEYLGPRDRFSAPQERLVARLERRAVASAAAVVAMTDWNAEALRREYGLPAERLASIHPGIEAAWWAAAAERRAGEPDGPLRILFVGNEVHRKGLDLLIEAVERLQLDAVLDVVSGDPVPDSDSVRAHRGVEPGSERLRELFAEADVFAFPSRADAVPWVVLEAMAAGLPVVASRVGAIEEMVGDAGELVAPGDLDQLVAALGRLADPERRRRLGERGLARAGERYDREAQVPRLVAFLREVAAADRAGPSSSEETALAETPKSSEAGELRMRRRTFVALGLGAAAAALLAPYAVLLPDDEFEQLVASRLGIEPQLAGDLLQRAREEYGDAEYEARAAAFAFAVRDPAAIVLPDSVRERAISSLLEPMLSAPAANLAYGVTRSVPGGPACAGLVRAA
jgi:glycosyltransferase involved in cell wall biosynthesis